MVKRIAISTTRPILRTNLLKPRKFFTQILPLFLLFVIVSSNTLITIPFSTPGIYTLTSRDYGNAETIIFEIWSAGGAGLRVGAGSGGYIKATTYTTWKHVDFIINVGKGGIFKEGCNCGSCLFMNGELSSVSSLAGLNLTVSGGMCGNDNISRVKGGEIISVIGALNYYNISGQDGIPGDIFNNIGGGGSAPFGGVGGYNHITSRDENRRGMPPGGGGGGLSSGASGAVIATFISKINIQS